LPVLKIGPVILRDAQSTNILQVDTYAKVSNRSEDEKALIAKAKLQRIVLQYVQGRYVWAHDACPYSVLREQLTERFSEKLPAQYHYTRLQDATQEKGESVEKFADRCRKLCQKTLRRVNDEATQRVINEEAERCLVAAYINGLGGTVGQQLRFHMPSSLEEAVQVAITISNAERTKQPDTKRVFSAKRDGGSPAVECYNCGIRGHYARDCRSRGKGDTPESSGRARHGGWLAAPGNRPHVEEFPHARGAQWECHPLLSL
jgi:hypothetical protein